MTKSDEPKKASPKSDEPKKHFPNQMNLKKYHSPLMIQASKNRSLKNLMEKIVLQNQETKLKRPDQIHPNLLTQARKKKKDCPKMIKRKKYLPCWG